MSDDFEEDVSASASDQQLSLFVNLDGFEGPIDLLLSLAREQKVDLGKISILPRCSSTCPLLRPLCLL